MAKKDKTRMNNRKYRRQMIRDVYKQASPDAEIFSRRVEDVDPFSGVYGTHRLIQPKFSFEAMTEIYEGSDVLQESVEAMVANVDGFGYELTFEGDDVTERETTEAQAQKVKASDFFDQINDTESFTSVRKLVRQDYEVLGIGAFEVVRNLAGEIQMLYWMPMLNLRMTVRDPRGIVMDTQVRREGDVKNIKVRKHFRKYAQVRRRAWGSGTEAGGNLRWFKEFGDPRMIDALDGRVKTRGQVKMLASEILTIQQEFGTLPYGLPRWVGAVLDVMGRRSAQFVNWDIFENQGIPPMAIMISGGVLTDESLEDLEDIVRGARSKENWNKVMILESTIEDVGMEEKGSAKIELKNLTEFRKDDLMFDKYLTRTGEDIRKRYRLPSLYVGGDESFTHATAKAAQDVAEEQVFIPERRSFDEIINMRLMRPELEINLWTYKTKGPTVVGSEQISKAVGTFTRAGAISANNAIDLANRAFGLSMSKFTGDWANFPINLVLKLVEQGKLKGIEEIVLETAPGLPAAPAQKMLPHLPVKIFKSDMFSDQERALYKRLLTLQHAIENVGDLDEEDYAGGEATAAL